MQTIRDAEVNLIMPLTKDRTALKARIDKLDTGGSTAGHLGTAWAYYLLSPNWNTVFANVSSTSAAGPYSDLTVTNSKGMPKLRKIAVLMTDGDYNINYCKGVEAKNSDQSPDINCNSENGKSLAQAGNLCTLHEERQDRGLHGRLPGRTRPPRRSSRAARPTPPTTTMQRPTIALQAAFRDIALKIATLRLTN